MEGADVLPSFLHEGDEEVDSHGEVLPDVFLGEFDAADGSTHAVGLLALELDSLLQFVDLGSNFFSFGKVDGETAHLDEHVTEKLGNLLAD